MFNAPFQDVHFENCKAVCFELNAEPLTASWCQCFGFLPCCDEALWENNLRGGKSSEKLRQELKAGTWKPGWFAHRCGIVANQGAHFKKPKKYSREPQRSGRNTHVQISSTWLDHLPWEWRHLQCARPYSLNLQSRQSPTDTHTD